VPRPRGGLLPSCREPDLMSLPAVNGTSRTLAIGLDGGSLAVFRRMAAQGHMPFFAKILKEGTSGELRSAVPPLTPTAWTTFMTGKNPGKHGIFDFRRYRNHAAPILPNNSTKIQADTLWSMLSRAGKRLAVVNVPMTYPPQPLNGTMMTGVMTPGTDGTFTYPADLYDELRPELGDYSIVVTWRGRRPKPFIRDLVDSTRQRGKYVRHLMERDPWDFFMVVFSETDSLQHALWSYLDPDDHRQDDPEVKRLICGFFRELDEEIEQICRAAGQSARVIFLSDHGFGPQYYWFYLNTWLEQQGWLTYEPKGLARARAVQKLHRLLRKWPLAVRSLHALHRALTRLLRGRKLLPRAEMQGDVLAAIDWPRTKAFFGSLGEQGIRINLRGREPDGIVEPGEEYEKLRDAIIAALGRLRHPQTGDPIPVSAWKREELFSGPHVGLAPDILLICDDLKYVVDVAPNEKAFEPVSPACHLMGNGFHRMEGMFAAWGPGIKAGGRLQDAGLEDVLPTILFSLQQPIPNDLDGRVLAEIFEPELLSQYAPEPAEAVAAGQAASNVDLSQEDSERVIEWLRGLGYID